MWALIFAFVGGLCSSLLTALSFTINKLAFKRNELSPTAIYKSRLWILANLCLIIGTSIGVVPLSLLGQSTNTGLSCLTIISSIIFARAFLKEPFSYISFLQLLMILIGAVLMLTYSTKNLQVFDLETLVKLF